MEPKARPDPAAAKAPPEPKAVVEPQVLVDRAASQVPLGPEAVLDPTVLPGQAAAQVPRVGTVVPALLALQGRAAAQVPLVRMVALARPDLPDRVAAQVLLASTVLRASKEIQARRDLRATPVNQANKEEKMSSDQLWTSTNLYGRRWQDTDADTVFYQRMVGDWPGVPAPIWMSARKSVRKFALGCHGIALPYTASTPEHYCCEVYMKRIADGDDVPIGGIWGWVSGTVWVHGGQAILPEYRGHKYSVEAGRASMNRFFSAAIGGTEVITEVIVSRLSERVNQLWTPENSAYMGERDGITGRIRQLRITKENHVARERARTAAASKGSKGADS